MRIIVFFGFLPPPDCNNSLKPAKFVDDSSYRTATSELLQLLHCQLRSFPVKDLGPLHYFFFGLEAARNSLLPPVKKNSLFPPKWEKQTHSFQKISGKIPYGGTCPPRFESSTIGTSAHIFPDLFQY
jgi:hypothetical protein